MERLRRIVGSSIGRKWLMSLSGLGLIGFLAVHLAGNLTIYGGGTLLNAYAATLREVGPALWVVEAGLGSVALVHILFASILVVENLRARATRYTSKRSEGGRSWGSQTMLVTGPYILVFVVAHLMHFTFSGSSRPIAELVAARFYLDAYSVGFYLISMALLGLHLSHGAWSALQTLGVPTLRRGLWRRAASVAALLVAVGFGSLPIAVYSINGLLR